MTRRNIINIEQVDLFIDNISKRYEDKIFDSFIKRNLRNYIVRKAPVKENIFFWMKKYSRKTSLLHKKILSNGGPYHQILLDEALSSKVNEIMDFLYSHKEEYQNKNNIIVEDVINKHLFWIRQLNKIVSSEEGTVEVCAEFKDQFTIVKLVDEQSYKREGSLMHHCVASYADRSASIIYSLRDPQNKPLVTFEKRGDFITQISAHSNAKIPNGLKKYINEFAKMNKLKFKTNYGGTGRILPVEPLVMTLFAFRWKSILVALGLLNDPKMIELFNSSTINNIIGVIFFLLAGIKWFDYAVNLPFQGTAKTSESNTI